MYKVVKGVISARKFKKLYKDKNVKIFLRDKGEIIGSIDGCVGKALKVKVEKGIETVPIDFIAHIWIPDEGRRVLRGKMKQIKKMQKAGEFSWEDVNNGVLRLVDLVRKSNFNPDIIVGVGRSGAIIAGLLAGNLGVLPVGVIDREYQRMRGGGRKVVIRRGVDVKNKKVLLVCGMLITGQTLKAAYDIIDKRGGEIKTLTMFKRTGPLIMTPDYYSYEIESIARFPWRLSADWKLGA